MDLEKLAAIFGEFGSAVIGLLVCFVVLAMLVCCIWTFGFH